MTPHSSHLNVRYGVFLCAHTLNTVLRSFLSHCVQYRVISDRNVSRDWDRFFQSFDILMKHFVSVRLLIPLVSFHSDLCYHSWPPCSNSEVRNNQIRRMSTMVTRPPDCQTSLGMALVATYMWQVYVYHTRNQLYIYIYLYMEVLITMHSWYLVVCFLQRTVSFLQRRPIARP